MRYLYWLKRVRPHAPGTSAFDPTWWIELLNDYQPLAWWGGL